jgi:RNase H-fold protein (predicted Holliday junction resolvase)
MGQISEQSIETLSKKYSYESRVINVFAKSEVINSEEELEKVIEEFIETLKHRTIIKILVDDYALSMVDLHDILKKNEYYNECIFEYACFE